VKEGEGRKEGRKGSVVSAMVVVGGENEGGGLGERDVVMVVVVGRDGCKCINGCNGGGRGQRW
jgi:hypothetical protein